MKIRSGYVSNSSSSSFVIALPSRPASVEQLHDWLFPDGPQANICWHGDIDSMSAAKAVFADLTDPIEIEPLAVLAGAYGAPVVPPTPRALIEEMGQAAADRFVRQNPGAVFYNLMYSDNDGPLYSALEHGDTWDNIPHVKESHH